MAVFYFSDAASLTADVMTNLYLYGKTETPVDLNDRIRARNGGSDQVKMDMEAFMRGPGRYALASNAYAVQILFGDSGNWFELNGKYTVGDLIAKKYFRKKIF